MRPASLLKSATTAAILAASGIAVAATPAYANTVTIPAQGGMNGAETLAPGTTVYGGYDFGDVSGATTQFLSATLVLDLSCKSGTASPSTVTISFPNQAYVDDNENSEGWVPSGEQSSSLTYQGSVVIPSACPGADVIVGQPNAGPFTAEVQSTNTSTSIGVRFHYGLASDFSSNGGTGTSWSATKSVVPDPITGPIVPVGAFGGLGVAAAGGIALLVAQRRRRRRPARAES